MFISFELGKDLERRAWDNQKSCPRLVVGIGPGILWGIGQDPGSTGSLPPDQAFLFLFRKTRHSGKPPHALQRQIHHMVHLEVHRRQFPVSGKAAAGKVRIVSIQPIASLGRPHNANEDLINHSDITLIIIIHQVPPVQNRCHAIIWAGKYWVGEKKGKGNFCVCR